MSALPSSTPDVDLFEPGASSVRLDKYDAAIVGGGFAGTAVAAGIGRVAGGPRSIVMFDRAAAFGRGAAYGPASDRCLLNVRAKSMGAFPDAEDGFLRWLRTAEYAAGDPELGERFVPRQLYGEYLCALLDRCSLDGIAVERRAAAVCEISVGNDGYLLTDELGHRVSARSVVLAIGNLPPAGTGDADISAALKRYALNPWAVLAGDPIEPDVDVFILGSGLSALDILLELHGNEHRGAITVLSRHGRFPLAHAATAAGRGAAHFAPAGSPRAVLRSVRQAVRDAPARKQSWHDVLDALRPHTNGIWQSWSEREKRQFDRHLGSLWAIHRHRAPAASLAARDALVAAGQLHIRSGVLSELSRDGTAFRVAYSGRVGGYRTTQRADIVVDCTGPARDIRRSGDPLVTSLFASGIVTPGALGLGFAAAPDGKVHALGPHSAVYALGTPLRGTLCESGAVNEIRVQAGLIAAAIACQPSTAAPASVAVRA